MTGTAAMFQRFAMGAVIAEGPARIDLQARSSQAMSGQQVPYERTTREQAAKETTGAFSTATLARDSVQDDPIFLINHLIAIDLISKNYQ
jgi:hypothetical protein